MTLQTDLETAVAKVTADSTTLHSIVHGPASGTGSTVTTEGGDVKTVAKAIADLEAAYTAANVVAEVDADRASAEAAANMAHAWAEEPEDVEVAPGQFSAHHWAAKAEQWAAGLNFEAHALRHANHGLEWTHGVSPIQASAHDEVAILPGSAVFSINANGHLEVTF